MIVRNVVAALSIIFLLVVSAPVAVAEDAEDTQNNRYLGDRFNLRLTGHFVDFSTDVAAGKGLGALIDLEEILGFDEEISSFGFDGHYRFTRNRKHTIRFNYANLDRSAYKAVSGTVPIFDVEFLGELASEFVNQMGGIAYQYSFTNTNKTEAGFMAGLAFYRYQLKIAGQIMIDNDPETTVFRQESTSILAPVPTGGFFINHAFRQNLILELRTSFIDLEFGEHNGRIFNTWGSLTWYFSRHFGVGVGISGSDIAYNKETGKDRFKVDIRQSGFNVNLNWVF